MPTNGKTVRDEAIACWSRSLVDQPLGAAAMSYLVEQRRLTPAIIADAEIGLYGVEATLAAVSRLGHSRQEAAAARVLWTSFDGWLVFPWRDGRGEPLGFVFRRLPSDAAPLDRLGRPQRYAFAGDRDALPLYGLDRALAAGHRQLTVVEGTLDVLALHAAGVSNVVGPNSCQLRVWHAADLKRRGIEEITLCLDADAPGQRGTERAIEAAMAVELKVKVAPPLPDGLDPDELVARDGAAAFDAHICAAIDGLAYFADRIVETQAVLPADEARAAALAAGCDLHTLRSPARRDDDLRQQFWPILADRFELSTAEIDQAVELRYAERHRERAARGLRPVPASQREFTATGFTATGTAAGESPGGKQPSGMSLSVHQTRPTAGKC